MASIEIEVEIWRGMDYGREVRTIAPSELADELDELARESSATLSMERGKESLIVGMSNGMCTVTAIVGEDGFLDLCGDRRLEGEVEFVSGGQGVEYPRRYIVSVEVAARVAREFAAHGLPSSEDWERADMADE